MSEEVLPDLFWLETQREQLRQAHAQQRLPHALLIHDIPGGGGQHLAMYAARLALCSARSQAPCGSCRECTLLSSALPGIPDSIQHPDLYWVSPLTEGEKTSQQISISQIRELREDLSRTSHGSSGASVAIISPADTLTVPAANALLKTLEEPRTGALIVLLTAAPGKLLATLRSRCLRMQLRLPPRAQIIDWLNQARGAGDWAAVLDVMGDAPLLALDADARHLAQVMRDTQIGLDRVLTGEPEAISALAAQWSKAEQLPVRLACIESWIGVRVGATPPSATQKSSSAASRQEALPVNLAALVRAHDAVCELVRQMTAPINKTLALELILLQVSRSRGS
jgi:DNA polymerase-3 subunit delta'